MLLALAAILAVQEKPEDFYKFKVGTTWVMEGTENGRKKKTTVKVTKHDGDKTFLESKEGDETTIYVWSKEEGHLVWSQADGDAIQPMFRVYKFGSKKGDTWQPMVGEGAEDSKATHLGTVDLQVPVGTYKDAIHIRFEFGGGTMEMNFYLVPKIGLVKIESKGPDDTTVYELKEYKEGK